MDHQNKKQTKQNSKEHSSKISMKITESQFKTPVIIRSPKLLLLGQMSKYTPVFFI